MVIYFYHHFFKFNQTFILEGCSKDIWVSETLSHHKCPACFNMCCTVDETAPFTHTETCRTCSLHIFCGFIFMQTSPFDLSIFMTVFNDTVCVFDIREIIATYRRVACTMLCCLRPGMHVKATLPIKLN